MPEALYAPLPGANVWIIPSAEASTRGFLDAMAWQEDEFSKPMFTADQMRAYADATCSLRGGQQGWMPIEECKREHGRRYLVARDCGPGTHSSVGTGYALDGLPGWCSDEVRGMKTLEDYGYRVTHFIPLPASPPSTHPQETER